MHTIAPLGFSPVWEAAGSAPRSDPFRVTQSGFFMARTASRGLPVNLPCTSRNPAFSSSRRYSPRVRSLPSVHTSILSDCKWADVGAVLSSCRSFSASRRPPARRQTLVDLAEQRVNFVFRPIVKNAGHGEQVCFWQFVVKKISGNHSDARCDAGDLLTWARAVSTTWGRSNTMAWRCG